MTSTGANYETTRDLNLDEVTKLIRDDLHAAFRGDGPLTGLTCVVARTGHSVISVEIYGLTHKQIWDGSERTKAIRAAAREIGNSYNHENHREPDSDIRDWRYACFVALLTKNV